MNRMFTRRMQAALLGLSAVLILLSGVARGQGAGHPRKHTVPPPGPASLKPDDRTMKEQYSAWRRTLDARATRPVTPGPLSGSSEDAPETILLTEGFEGATFPPAGWTTAVVSGSPDWEMSTSSPHTGNSAAYSEFGPTIILSKVYLITKRVTLNPLLQYRLTFWIKRGFTSPFDPDTVRVKLSLTDSLAPAFVTNIYKCYTGPDGSPDPNIYTTTYKQFTATFSGYGGTAWLAFSHENTDGQSIDLDDVQLEEIVNNDLVALSVDDPSSGARKNQGVAFTPKATFKNNGVVTQTFIPVRMRIYASGPTPVYDNLQTIPTLAPNAAVQVSFGSFTPTTGGNYTASALAQNPGDTNPLNDSTAVQFRVPENIAGTKNVGPGGDFTTIGDAIRYLNENNVAGPLVFQLTTSSYTEAPVTVEKIYYTSSYEPVTLKPAAGVSPVVTFVATPTLPFGLRIRGASFFTLDGSNNGSTSRNLTLGVDTSGYFASSIVLAGGSSEIVFKNAVIKGFSRYDLSASSAIRTVPSASGGADSVILFENLKVTRAFNGFFFEGPPGQSKAITVRGCDFGDTGIDAITQAGVAAYAVDGLVIQESNIQNIRLIGGLGNLFGIYLGDSCTNAVVTGNRIHGIRNSANGRVAVGLESAVGMTSNLLCANNFLYDILCSGNGSGENFTAALVSSDPASAGERFYFNSINLVGRDSSVSPTSYSAGIEIEGNAPGTLIKNNIVVNAMTFGASSGSNKGYCIAAGTSSWPAGSTSDYNDLAPSGVQGVVGFFNGVNRVTLTDWRTATGQDVHSISQAPLYISTTDLHLQSGSPAGNVGIPIAGVIDDIDGDLRSVTTPDMGADEFGASGIAVGVPVTAGWNLLSNPVVTGADSVLQLFPSSSFPYVFGFGTGGYAQRYRMANGAGYWGKFPAGLTQNVSGGSNLRDTIPMVAGWQIVGSLSSVIDTSQILDPGGIRLSAWFAYSLGYAPSTQIVPGKGYWVKARTSGNVIFSTGTSEPPRRASRPASSPDRLNSLTVGDGTGAVQTLYFGSGQDGTHDADFSLPPPPPEGVFDARFETPEGGAMTMLGIGETIERRVAIRTIIPPVTVRWEVVDGGQYVLRESASGQEFPMRESGAAVLDGTRALSLTRRTTSSLPVEYTLYQNYPNPFNPVTTIRFAVADRRWTALRVYDLLGREVATLVDGVKEPGTHTVQWDASGAASGVYVCRLTAGGVEKSRRMLLVR